MKPTTAEIFVLKQKYNASFAVIILAVILTIINMGLAFAQAEIYFLFSLTVPMWLIWPQEFAQGDILAILFFFAALAMVSVFGLFCLLAKRRFAFMVIVLTILCIDTAFLLVLVLSAFLAGEAGVWDFIDLFIHAYLIIAVSKGVAKGIKLRERVKNGIYLTEGELFAMFETPAEEREKAWAEAEKEAGEGAVGNGLPDSPVLRDFSNKGLAVTRGFAAYDHSAVCIYERNSTMEFVINGKVYAEKKGIFPKSCEFVCNYHGVKYKYTRKVKFLKSEETLCANDEVLFVRTSI